MPLWNNSDLILYHGTDDLSIPGASGLRLGAALTAFKVDLRLCRPFTDFGQGFYLTTSDHQARQWANARLLRILAPTGPSPNAIVLRFRIKRDWLAGLDMLPFVRPTNDFWNLVKDCRNGFPPHQRALRPPCYDVVVGPVSLWRQIHVIQDCDQVSFHTQRAVGGLASPVIADRGTGPGGEFV